LPGKRWHCNMILEALVFLIFLLWTRLNKRDGFGRIRLRRFVLGSTWISQYRSISWAISHRCKISLASPNWVLTWQIVFWLQLWRPLTAALNLFPVYQKDSTASWKPSSLVQNASKWNLALLGWTSFGPNRSGHWSNPSVALLLGGN
jgi:hypothetical protein